MFFYVSLIYCNTSENKILNVLLKRFLNHTSFREKSNMSDWFKTLIQLSKSCYIYNSKFQQSIVKWHNYALWTKNFLVFVFKFTYPFSYLFNVYLFVYTFISDDRLHEYIQKREKIETSKKSRDRKSWFQNCSNT